MILSFFITLFILGIPLGGGLFFAKNDKTVMQDDYWGMVALSALAIFVVEISFGLIWSCVYMIIK